MTEASRLTCAEYRQLVSSEQILGVTASQVTAVSTCAEYGQPITYELVHNV